MVGLDSVASNALCGIIAQGTTGSVHTVTCNGGLGRFISVQVGLGFNSRTLQNFLCGAVGGPYHAALGHESKVESHGSSASNYTGRRLIVNGGS